MSYDAQVIEVLVASPGDVAKERQAIQEAIQDLNASYSKSGGVHLVAVGWERYATPELGDRPQEILNDQFVRHCDMLIAVFWHRLGTPTGAADSGTVEEIREMMELGRPVMVYFCDRDVPSDVDTAQLEQLRAFRSEMESQGIVDSFSTAEDLRMRVSRHLSSRLVELVRSPAQEELVTPGTQRTSVMQGVAKVARRAAEVYTPHGGRVSIGTGVQTSGVAIASAIQSADTLEARGIALAREAAAGSSGNVGDGSKLAVIFGSALFEAGAALLEQGIRQRDLVHELDQAFECVDAHLRGLVVEGASRDLLRATASTASGDALVADRLLAALEAAGDGGVVTVERGPREESGVDLIEGFELSSGLMSAEFITDQEQRAAVLEEPLVLLHDRRIGSMKDLLPVLEKVAQTGQPLLIVAQDVEGEALATLTVNKLRGTLMAVPIRWRATGDFASEVLDDLAVFTGGQVISETRGFKLENAVVSDLGICARAVVESDRTLLLEGQGDRAAVSARVAQLRRRESREDGLEKERLTARIASLGERLAVVRTGGATHADAIEEYHRHASALAALASAMEGGCIPGAGAALGSAATHLKGADGIDSSAAEAVRIALLAPIMAQARVAHADHDSIETRLTDGRHGLDVVSGSVVDVVDTGLMDAADVLLSSRARGYRMARGALLTSSWEPQGQ